ncbi:hypothetical protein OROMI_032925 [Orobanche minor]
MTNGKFMGSYNPYHGIVHLHAFITVVFRPEGQELTIETLDCLDTYFLKWFLHVCYQEQQDQVVDKEVQEMRELRIPIRKTNPIHNDVSANTIFLLLDQPSGEANTTSMLINKIDEVAIKAVNWKTRVMLFILQDTNKDIIPFDTSISQKLLRKYIIKGF